MRRQVVGGALGTLLAVGLIAAAPAAARTTGKQSFRGTLVASGDSGKRIVEHSVIVARGVFRGVGRIVEVPSRPGDPDNVTRDDLVFRGGRMHLISTGGTPTVVVDPKTCMYTVTIPQTARIEGGTRRFRRASGSFTGTVRARGVAARTLTGTCSQTVLPLLDVDFVAGRGRLSF